MDRRLFTRLLIIFILSWSLLGAPLGAYAHGDEAHLELNTTQAGPGATIDLRGVGFDPESDITIMLVGAQRQLLLGAVSSDETGDFTQALSLPADLLPGAYEVRAADSHHSTSIPLNIIASAGAEEEGEQRGEEEPLLAPMPARAASVAPPSSQTPAASPLTAVAGEKSAAWLFVLLGTLALAGLALALKRRSVR